MRLDSYLGQYYPEYSRSTWQKYIKAGHVKVNDETITSSKHSLGEDDQVSYGIPTVIATKATIPIIFEDENIVVINKPAGILTHAKGAIADEFTVADFIKPYLSPDLKSPNNRAGIVHRLDRDTSGVMILARNVAASTYLQKRFASREVKKEYIAVVQGVPKQPEAHIDLPIERNPKAPSQFRVGASGKAAQTYYKVIAERGGFSILKLIPTTGRTHQLRVHLSYIGAPVLGDRIYDKDGERLFLHAYKLEITIPDGLRKVFKATMPAEFKKYFPEVIV